jgi:glycine dehydrogenase subunit 2
MDYFIECMIEADRLTKEDPETLKKSPKTMPITRLDETKAARDANCALL